MFCPLSTGPKQAAQPDAPLIHEHPEKFSKEAHGNFLAHFNLENGNLDDGFEQSDVVIEREYTTQTVEHAFIEPEAALAVPDATGASRFIAADKFRSTTARASPHR